MDLQSKFCLIVSSADIAKLKCGAKGCIYGLCFLHCFLPSPAVAFLSLTPWTLWHVLFFLYQFPLVWVDASVLWCLWSTLLSVMYLLVYLLTIKITANKRGTCSESKLTKQVLISLSLHVMLRLHPRQWKGRLSRQFSSLMFSPSGFIIIKQGTVDILLVHFV